jgi:excisionase family DNA binding protein
MKTNNIAGQLLTVKQVAHYLHVDQITIYRLIMEGKLPAYNLGDRWRFKKPMVEKWLEQNRYDAETRGNKKPKIRYHGNRIGYGE